MFSSAEKSTRTWLPAGDNVTEIGTFRWLSTGEIISNSDPLWASGYPQTLSSRSCLAVDISDGSVKLVNIVCHTYLSARYFCEVPWIKPTKSK